MKEEYKRMLGWSKGVKDWSVGWQDLEGEGKDIPGKEQRKDEDEERV